MTATLANEIRIVIGSWGSYNACNEKALGSKWFSLSNYNDFDEIEEELTKDGFKLDGIDEELFIQDIENLDIPGVNFDYIKPKRFFDTLKESEVLTDIDKFNTMRAYIEVRSFDDFENLVNKYGHNWNDDIYLYPDYDYAAFGKERLAENEMRLPNCLVEFFDFEAYGKSFEYNGTIEKYSGGLIEIN